MLHKPPVVLDESVIPSDRYSIYEPSSEIIEGDEGRGWEDIYW